MLTRCIHIDACQETIVRRILRRILFASKLLFFLPSFFVALARGWLYVVLSYCFITAGRELPLEAHRISARQNRSCSPDQRSTILEGATAAPCLLRPCSRPPVSPFCITLLSEGLLAHLSLFFVLLLFFLVYVRKRVRRSTDVCVDYFVLCA